MEKSEFKPIRRRNLLIIGGISIVVIIVALIAIFILRPANVAGTRITFPDLGVNDSDYEAAVAMVGYGLLALSDNGDFAPNQSLSRAEFARLVQTVFALSGNRPLEPAFSDVLPSHPDYAAIESCKSLLGYSANPDLAFDKPLFRPDEPILRQDATAAIARAMNLNPVGPALANQLGLAVNDPIFADSSNPLTHKDTARLFSLLIKSRLPSPAPSFEYQGIR